MHQLSYLLGELLGIRYEALAVIVNLPIAASSDGVDVAGYGVPEVFTGGAGTERKRTGVGVDCCRAEDDAIDSCCGKHAKY